MYYNLSFFYSMEAIHVFLIFVPTSIYKLLYTQIKHESHYAIIHSGKPHYDLYDRLRQKFSHALY